MGKHLFHILLILPILLILSPVSGFPQKETNEKKTVDKQGIYLDASAGASFPLGNYGNDDPKNDASCFAKPGFFIQANADWMGKNNFGLAFQLSYQNNSLQDTAETVILDGSSFPMGSGNWSNIYVMAGPVFLKLVNKIAIDAKLLGGFLVSTTPVFKTTNPETKMNSGGTGTGFAMGLNIGVGYALSQRVALKLTLGYTAGFPKIEKQSTSVIGIDSLTGQYIYSSPTGTTRKRTVSTFNSGLGIIYKF